MLKQLGNICKTRTRENPNQGRVYAADGIAPCLNGCGGGNRQPMIVDVRIIERRREETICLGGLGGLWGTQYHQQDRVYSMGEVAMCHPANIPGGSYLYLEVKDGDKENAYETGSPSAQISN